MLNKSKGLVTHKQKSLDVDLCLIVKNWFLLFDLFLYAPVNSYDHAGMFAVERDIKQIVKQKIIIFQNKMLTQVYIEGFSLMW